MCTTQIWIVITFVIVSIFFWTEKKRPHKNVFVAFTFAMVLVVVFRDSSMADYTHYYDSVVSNSGGDRFEPSFHFIRYIANFTNYPWVVFCFVYACLSVCLRMIYIKNESSIFWGSVLVYISNIFITQDMIAIRASVASAILLYTIKYNLEGSRHKIILIILCASLFHYSAFLFSIVLFLDNEKRNRKIYISFLLCSYFFAINGYTLGSFLYYIDNDYLTNNYILNSNIHSLNIFNLIQVGHILICILAWYYIDRIMIYDKANLLYLKLYTLGIGMAVLYSDNVTLALRMSE